MSSRARHVTILATATLLGTVLTAQTPSSSTAAFEVASMKANTSGAAGGSLRPTAGGRVDGVNMALRDLVLVAYDIPPFRLAGAPNWIGTVRYDIIAKLASDPSRDPAVASSDASQDMRNAVRALLIDRCKLLTHQETRALNIYALVLTHPGTPSAALKRSNCVAASPAAQRAGLSQTLDPTQPLCGIRASAGRIQARGVRMSQFASTLSGHAQVGRVVVDRTGLEGNWDFELTFAPPTPASATSDADAPSMFTALDDQLGLKLESTKGPVDVLVIDHIERPTED